MNPRIAQLADLKEYPDNEYTEGKSDGAQWSPLLCELKVQKARVPSLQSRVAEMRMLRREGILNICKVPIKSSAKY